MIFEIQYQIIRHLSALRNIGLLDASLFDPSRPLQENGDSVVPAEHLEDAKRQSEEPLPVVLNTVLALFWKFYTSIDMELLGRLVRQVLEVSEITQIEQFSGERLPYFYFWHYGLMFFFLKEIASKRRRLAKATEDLEDLKSRFEGLRWGFGWIGGDSSRMIGLKWGKMVEPLNLIFSWGFQALPLVYQPTYDSLGVAQNILKRPGCRQSPVNKAAIFWANMNLLWGGLESEWFHQNVKVMSWAEVSEWLPSISKSSIHTSGC